MRLSLTFFITTPRPGRMLPRPYFALLGSRLNALNALKSMVWCKIDVLITKEGRGRLQLSQVHAIPHWAWPWSGKIGAWH